MRVIIIGAGSAGLMFSLILSHFFPSCNIKIIRDPNTKVIGVGESTTQPFLGFLSEYLGIDTNDFIINVKPVDKYGIYFEFGKKDFHFTFDTAFDYAYFDESLPVGFKFEGGNNGDTPYSILMNEKSVKGHSGAFHIDNQLFLKYLEKIAVERGIQFVSDKITSIQRKGDDIVSLNKKYHADYFIDCSGFKPVLSEEKFHSYKETLVNDRALFFRTKTKHEIRPYTKSSTMNSGWLWEIDHSQGYTGNGYVYSSKYITDDDALTEVQNKLRIKIQDYRIIPFKTGRLEKHWVGNVVTIGNADGFVEPLEATSLMVIFQLSKDVVDIIKYGDKKGDLIERYNKQTNQYYDNIRDFILIHFVFNDKLNTKYWKDYKKRWSKIPKDSIVYDILSYYLNNDTHIKFLSHVFGTTNPYGLEGWYSILRGLIPSETDRKKWSVILKKYTYDHR